jgi:23S rRNA (cytosine1962-C5)-methyltransferase
VRLVHGEGDELPGLIVDQLGDVLSLQLGTIGMKRRLEQVLTALRTLNPRAIVDRTSERSAKMEGFSADRGVLEGADDVSAFEFRERGLEFRIPFELGQKTGYYLDQRPLRARIEALAAGRRVLDTFCYVGSCAFAAARGGASEVRGVDSSKLAIEVGAECAARNGLAERVQLVEGDAQAALRAAADQGGYDLVVCDPPKLAPNRGARRRAVDVMRKLAAAGCRATTNSGLFVLCSCSAAIGLSELTRALALGARDAGARAIVLERVFQGADHPVPAPFPEGLYLTSLVARIERD